MHSFKKKFILLLAMVAFGQMAFVFAQEKTTYKTLIWADEFDTPGAPDSAKWSYNTGTGCPQNCGWGNNESQYYTRRPENIVVENGILKIKALREQYEGSPFTSARILSKGKFEVQYGRIEVRARVPEGVGTWPAIWMLGSTIDKVGWPACGEIDIMEHKGALPNTIYGTLHYPGYSGGKANGNTVLVPSATRNFNVYAAEWSRETISIFVNDLLIHRITNHTDIPFHHNFFILLNLAMGGHFGGEIDPALKAATFEVDYVRVYK